MSSPKHLRKFEYRIKTSLLHYFSLEWGFRTSTEVVTDYGRADIMTFNGKKVVEVEIKVTLEDLKRDIEKRKHKLFEKPRGMYKRIPNQMYYCMPTFMLSFAKDYFKESPYGIMAYDKNRIEVERLFEGKDGLYYKPAPGRKVAYRVTDKAIFVVKRAKFLTHHYSDKLESYVVDSLANKLYKRYEEINYEEAIAEEKELNERLGQD